MPVLDKEILHEFDTLYPSSTDRGLELSHSNVNDTHLIPPDNPLSIPQAPNSEPHDISEYIPKDPTDLHIPRYNTWHQGVRLPTTRGQCLNKAQLRRTLPQMERKIIQDTPLSMEQLQDRQANDSFCAPLLQYLNQGILPTNPVAANTLLNMVPHYLSFKNVLIVIHFYPVSSNRVLKIKLVIPKALVHDHLLTLHTSTVGAHRESQKR